MSILREIQMKPSIWTSYLIELLPREMTKVFAGHGWQFLELGEEHGHDLLKEGDPLKTGRDFKLFAENEGITFLQGHFCMSSKGYRPEDMEGRTGVDIAPAGEKEFASIMDYMKQWVDLFNAMGIKAGVIHIGGNSLAAAGWPEERIFSRRLEALRNIAGYAKGGATVLCLENTALPGSREINELLDIIKAAGCENTGICLDTGHANISGVNPSDFIMESGGYLKALHIDDNMGKTDDHILPYAKGTVCWPDVLKSLHRIGYEGLFNFEVPGEISCPMPVRLNKLDYIRNLAETMISL